MMIETLAVTLDTETLARVFGRAHPILVHFPIALLLTAFGLELVRVVRRADRPSGTALTCCGLGVLGAIAAGVSGWINADVETHSARVAETMEWHRWIAIVAAGIVAAAWVLGVVARRPERVRIRRWWVTLLALGAAGIGFAGHLGGDMVWGSGYLLRPIFGGERPGSPVPEATETSAPNPPKTPETAKPSDAQLVQARRLAPAGTVLSVSFQQQVWPILQSKCVECHTESKQKGDLRLDDLSSMFKGDPTFWTVKPGEPDDSELVYRIRLGTDSEDRMPPEGPPLSPTDVGTISRWIAEGAWEGVQGDAAPAQPTSAAKPTAVIESPAWTPEESAAVAALRALGGRVEPVAVNDARLEVNLGVAGQGMTDAGLLSVATLGPRVRSLDVSGSGISDAGLATALQGLISLERLNASRTAAGDKTAATLRTLPVLEQVSLFESALTEAGAAELAASATIRKVFASRASAAAPSETPPPTK